MIVYIIIPKAYNKVKLIIKEVFTLADNNNVSVAVRFPQAVADGMKALADIHGVTVSDYIRMLVTADLEKNKEFLDDYQRKLAELRSKMKAE